MSNAAMENLITHFSQISGMEITLLDDKLRTLYSQKSPSGAFCAEIHKSAKCLKLCQQSDEECTERAKNQGAPVHFTCPFGIKEVVVPIVRNDKVIAYLLCSMGLSPDCSDERPIKAAVSEFPSVNQTALKSAVSRLARLSGQQVECYLDLLSAIATHLSVNGEFSEQAPTVGELVKNFINANLSRKITLADLSYHIHYSKATLTQHFKKEFGISIVDYMTKKRIELSKKLLLSTDKPLCEIAALCGFDDTEYFSRTFKRFNALPPGAWRKENK